MSSLYDTDTQQQPLFTPHSLIVRFVRGTLYDEAKQFLEGHGLIVRDIGLSWENHHVLHVTTPDENLDKWVIDLHASPIILLVEKERFSYPA